MDDVKENVVKKDSKWSYVVAIIVFISYFAMAGAVRSHFLDKCPITKDGLYVTYSCESGAGIRGVFWPVSLAMGIGAVVYGP